MKIKAQTAIEYLLLLAVVAVVVLIGFRSILPSVHSVSGVYFDKVSQGIMGDPPPCMGTVLEDVTVNGGNAALYFDILAIGPTDYNGNCEKKDYNKWCHWANNMIGCFEVSDDDGGDDCRYDNNHSNYIHYRWKGTPITKANIDYISVTTDTHDSVCSSTTGEDDDGLRYGTFTWVFSDSLGWQRQVCSSGGSHGPYRVTIVFDGSGNFQYIEVRAGDHHDEGTFQILSAEVNFKPLTSCP